MRLKILHNQVITPQILMKAVIKHSNKCEKQPKFMRTRIGKKENKFVSSMVKTFSWRKHNSNLEQDID